MSKPNSHLGCWIYTCEWSLKLNNNEKKERLIYSIIEHIPLRLKPFELKCVSIY